MRLALSQATISLLKGLLVVIKYHILFLMLLSTIGVVDIMKVVEDLLLELLMDVVHVATGLPDGIVRIRLM